MLVSAQVPDFVRERIVLILMITRPFTLTLSWFSDHFDFSNVFLC